MNLAKYIVLGIVSGIFNMYPTSYPNHIMLYQELFNTKIFYDTNVVSILNISLILAILVLYSQDIMNFFKLIIRNMMRKDKKVKTLYSKSYRKYIICLLITMGINLIFYLVFRRKINNFKSLAYCYVITTIILMFIRSNKGQKKDKDISYIDAILIGLSSLIIVIPSNTVLLGNLLVCCGLKIQKKTSLRYALTCQLPILFLEAIPGIVYFSNDTTYLFEAIVAMVISCFVSLEIYKSLKYMFYTNKLHRLALYTLLLAIFIFYWFS